jgi:lipoprotein-anchoring transpeptidase ErfK/SrfK
MPPFLNGRTLLGTAFVGLVALSTVMLMREPPQPAKVVAAPTQAPAKLAAAAPRAPADEPFTIKRILPISGPIKYGEWHWDEGGVPAGPIVVTVDLDARVISVFRNGYEIGAAAVLLGSQDKPTPLGVFPIMEKKRDHTSNLYDAEMPYMQRLTNDGITLHATKVAWGYASHGCIGMPMDFAKKVFETTHVGDKVYITRGKMVGLGDKLT